jgi:hypothetical protein
MIPIGRCFRLQLDHLPFRRFTVNRRSMTRASKSFGDAVTVVDDYRKAETVIKILQAHPEAIWACDTEVADINVKEQSPVGNGKVICVSIFGGDHIDFGSGSAIWIDNTNEVLQFFKGWFEDCNFKKVWHNYGFDRHVMYNEGIDCKGFFGDTMHMARLWDTSRDKINSGGEGYSLASLTTHFFESDKRFIKTPMKDLFGVSKTRKDGTPSKIKELPDLRELQNHPVSRNSWIDYSARDAVATWWVRKRLEEKLEKMPWVVDGKTLGNMYDFYSKYLRDFGELLTDMERNGIKVDTQHHLRQAEIQARYERDKYEKMFLEWASTYCKDGKFINIASTSQIQQLLFGHYENGQLISRSRTFKIEKSDADYANDLSKVLNVNPYANLSSNELKLKLKERGIKLSGKKQDLEFRLLEFDRIMSEATAWDENTLRENLIARGLKVEGNTQELVQSFMKSEIKSYISNAISSGTSEEQDNALKKYREITIETVGLTPSEFTETGLPQVSASVLKKLAGKNLFSDGKHRY